MPAEVLSNPEALGWYAVGVRGESGSIDWSGAGLYEYIGDGEWVDEEGEPVLAILDPDLGVHISINSADGYILQGGG